MVKIPFIHFHHERSDRPRHLRKPFTWLQREDGQFSRGRSSLFYLAHDTPQAPSVTCIQGHEILPGETTCIHGHPVG